MKMFPFVKYAWVVVNAICALILTFQLCIVLDGYINPSVTHTWEKDVRLEDIKEFPVVFKICVIPGFNSTALNEVGYNDSWSYFLGKSRFDNSTYGWAGHSELGNDSLGSVEEVLSRVIDQGQSGIFKRIYVWTTDEDEVDIPLGSLNSGRVTYPHNCHHLDLSTVDEMKNKGVEDLYIELAEMNNMEQYSVEIRLKGRSLNCNRDIKDHHFFSSGENIKFEFQEKKESIEYAVEISLRAFVEEDPTKSCKIYPTLEHESYEACDDDYTWKEIEEIAPGLVPVWMTENLGTVSTKVFDQNGAFGRISKNITNDMFILGILPDLFDGSHPSDCPLPCSTTNMQTKFLHKYPSAINEIGIAFSPNVKVTTTDMLKPTLTGLLSKVKCF